MVLKRADEPAERVGIAGMRTIIRALIAAGMPLVFGPGAIHLPTVPEHRKWNRIDLGTADKVASAALGIVDQATRLGIGYEETRFVLLELGGAFSAALAVDGGRIVDGVGGSAGPIGARACGALDAEAAYLIGGALSKRTVFSGGALDPDGRLDLGAPGALAALRADAAARDGWLALEEGAAKAVLALTASVPAPREVLVAGRLAEAPGLLEALGERLAGVAPVRAAMASKSAARGAALLADGLAGGPYAPLVDGAAAARGARRRARPPADVRRGADHARLSGRRLRAQCCAGIASRRCPALGSMAPGGGAARRRRERKGAAMRRDRLVCAIAFVAMLVLVPSPAHGQAPGPGSRRATTCPRSSMRSAAASRCRSTARTRAQGRPRSGSRSFRTATPQRPRRGRSSTTRAGPAKR